jgi:hypothetical protein
LIAAKLKIPEESPLFFIDKMAREKKIKITGIINRSIPHPSPPFKGEKV